MVSGVAEPLAAQCRSMSNIPSVTGDVDSLFNPLVYIFSRCITHSF